MPHTSRDSITGHMLRLPVSKHLALGPKCGYCPGCCDADSMDVEFSGVGSCHGCFPAGWLLFGSSCTWATPPSINPDGTFTLARDGTNPCLWKAIAYPTLAVNLWYNGTCSGTRDQYLTSGSLVVQLTVTATQRILEAFYEVPRPYGQPDLRIGAFYFGEAAKCLAGGGSNVYTTCAGGAGFSGGGATIAAHT
jgi:hypothetical protein